MSHWLKLTRKVGWWASRAYGARREAIYSRTRRTRKPASTSVAHWETGAVSWTRRTSFTFPWHLARLSTWRNQPKPNGLQYIFICSKNYFCDKFNLEHLLLRDCISNWLRDCLLHGVTIGFWPWSSLFDSRSINFLDDPSEPTHTRANLQETSTGDPVILTQNKNILVIKIWIN